MSIIKLTRREFLKTSGTAASGIAAGGFALGVMIPTQATAASSEIFEPNAFVHIDSQGKTTIHCGRCEMGQGISTALPAAVADELEADWSRVTVLQAEGNEDKYGPQATGGSRSINIMFEPMREAGASARLMLTAAAAQVWKVKPTDCYAENHFVYNKKTKQKLAYGQLASIAAEMPVPEKPKLKTKDQYRYIGKPVPRHDVGEVVVGKRTYGIDTRVKGMKYAAIKHVPVYGGKVKSFDASEAEKMKGVIKVVNIPRFEAPYGSLGGIGVVADNTWTAQQALAKIQIEWDRGPHGVYNTKAYKAAMVKQVENPAKPIFKRGDLKSAFDNAKVTHSATYVQGHLSHSPMEPMVSTVSVTDDACEVWASTQDPAGIQRTLGAYLGREPKTIKVNVMMAGGGFGRKFKCDYVQEAAALSKAVGAPVQLAWSREEDTKTGYYHSTSAQHLEGSVDDKGHLTGWLHRSAFPTIGSTFDPSIEWPREQDLGAVINHPYGIKNFEVESGHAPAHTRIGWYRAVRAIFEGFAFNSFTDELAHKSGTDSLAFFRNIYRNNKDPEQKEKVERSLAVLELAAEKGEWGKKLPKNHGLGIAVHHSFESYLAMVVHAEVDGDKIKVHRVDCAVDCGEVLNPDGATAQMEGAVIMGMSLALYTEVSFKDGEVMNTNFHDYPVLRTNEVPPIINVHFAKNDYKATGLGEPGVPTFAPALTNAIFAASGKRYRSLPIKPIYA
ncbi:xanthine dehydrogenase family protein molybdopterin-binding subunit [Aliikangiella marina]|uniref:Xanthine dehydrogenase family protein molybdopterin-binding subunit n=1 Tax=Aliikangiella marina TaxID=1712262 RepID=A0A545T6J3_9GAMM|nr:molybdopterin cofactor-binding domain-containing protein [Aliikangiella marina]TQV72792.1 xanthine dehydrogenase family protein molybdopterin-binding subunit [Aliikangiella marina]